jgi:tetratricopeptide (TPR) repeat protein
VARRRDAGRRRHRQRLGSGARARHAGQEALRLRDRAEAAQRGAQNERDRAVTAEHAAQEQRARAVEEKRPADTESATATAISSFLRDDLLEEASFFAQVGGIDPDLKVRTAVDRTAARIGDRFQGQPAVEAAIRQTIGQAYQRLGVYPEAERQIQRAFQLRRRALGENHPETLASIFMLARTNRLTGKYSAAEDLLLPAVEKYE